ncbi:MAG: hypothetical protein A2W25_07695 [candidate division Zixibacteria bacterium RBG_16_53_22]|nr:MAG: hypothetical protein A2W25_07695 [candidate division Zixibacteria bacterium RBG_16_53_22]
MSAIVAISSVAVILIGLGPEVEFVASVGKNIDGLDLNNPQCLAVNPVQEEFLVADALNDRVVIFDTLGQVVHAFPLGSGRRNPFGIAVNSQGQILVGAMDAPELWLFDYSGVFLESFALPDSVLPGRLLFHDNGEILMVDRSGKGIMRLDSAGNVLGSIVTTDPRCKPSSVFIDGSHHLAMISSGGKVMTGFDQNGQVLYSIGDHGRRPEDFSYPTATLVDSIGWLWVIDSFRHHVKRFDSKGNFVDIFGQRGVNPGEFYFPTDIKLTPSGKLAILDKGIGRLQIFRLTYGEK